MLLSAVSLALAVVASGEDIQLSPKEAKLWKNIESSVVYLLRDGQPIGSAALIDERGYFLTHSSAGRGRFEAKMVTGQVVELVFKATDEPTQLSLFIAENWSEKSLKPVVLSAKDEPAGEPLFAILPSGPIRASFHAGDKVGMISKRAMSLSEIRFEAQAQNVGGALVFTQDGELLGALNATLQPTKTVKLPGTAEMVMQDFANRKTAAQMGPAQLTVAYTVGPDALRRVVEGFKSPTHVVSHPAIGIMCVDTPGNEGALVDSVRVDSQAALAGVKKGDIIVEMAGAEIKSKVDYARVLLRQKVGASITLKLKRGNFLMFVPLTVSGR